MALADNAERTLDLQYYLIDGDDSGKALLSRVRAAADRGVRVRILIDDLNTSGQDSRMLRLTRHPNIEVRLYNPFPAGRFSTVSKVAASITDIGRINHRMHNKLFVADNAMAVTGGRNVGDAYFVRSASSNFVDLDVVVAGQAVRSLSSTFDEFWNDALAYAVTDLVTVPPDNSPASSPVPAFVVSPQTSNPDDTGRVNQLARELAAGRLDLTWAAATVIADRPATLAPNPALDPDDAAIQPVIEEIKEMMNSVNTELVVISPYFVPGKDGIALFTSLAQRGVKLRILTNSLATTDAPAVHLGYAKYRPELLSLGTELYELRPRLGTTKSRIGRFGSSQASLHAKALVFDRRVVVIGSMNMDPRSARLNSEMGLIIKSPFIASQVVQLFEDVGKAGSYRVELEPDKSLQWTAAAPDEGRPLGAALATGAGAPKQTGIVVSHDEPEASAWLRFTMKLLAPFAPEELL
jgi:putative cardiolipin synthase